MRVEFSLGGESRRLDLAHDGALSIDGMRTGAVRCTDVVDASGRVVASVANDRVFVPANEHLGGSFDREDVFTDSDGQKLALDAGGTAWILNRGSTAPFPLPAAVSQLNARARRTAVVLLIIGPTLAR
jgi:hypothetical protein